MMLAERGVRVKADSFSLRAEIFIIRSRENLFLNANAFFSRHVFSLYLASVILKFVSRVVCYG